MWILPTFNRPDRLRATLASIRASGCTTDGCIIINGQGSDYEGVDDDLPADWECVRFADNIGFCGALDFAFERWPNEPWYGILSDDNIVRTPGFDLPLIAAAGHSGFANSADGWQGDKRMHGGIVFGGDLLRAVGWWAPPGLWHAYMDDAWEHMGRKLGNWTYVPEVMVEHCHAWNGKAAHDATYHNAYVRLEQDKATYAALLRAEIPEAIGRAAVLVCGADKSKLIAIRAKARSVLISTPTLREPCWPYVNSLVQTTIMMDRMGIPFGRNVTSSSNLPRCRNELVARFMASHFTDMVFVDDDMEWSASDIITLLGSDKEICGGVGRKRTDIFEPCGKPRLVDGNLLVQDDLGFIEYEKMGTGILRISRRAIETIIEAHPELKRPGDNTWPQDVQDNYYRLFHFPEDDDGGEDYAFCKLWRDLGGTIWANPKMKIGHIGLKNWQGCVGDYMIVPEAAKPSDQIVIDLEPSQSADLGDLLTMLPPGVIEIPSFDAHTEP